MTIEQIAILRADMRRHQRLAMACEEACIREHHEAIAEALAEAVECLENPTRLVRFVLIGGGPGGIAQGDGGSGGNGCSPEFDMGQYDLHAISVACTRAAERERKVDECRSVIKCDLSQAPSPGRVAPSQKRERSSRRRGK